MQIGDAIGKLHDGGLIHGDLTISNMLIRSNTNQLGGRKEKLPHLILPKPIIKDIMNLHYSHLFLLPGSN
ncbi:hypothetical protein ACSBR2_021113 [Camellia fascicularis]